MQSRHRIPTIFNLYMVDVLCCALGCVILLWQMNYFEAQEQGSAADSAEKKLSEARLQILALNSRVDSLAAGKKNTEAQLTEARLRIDSLASAVDSLKVGLEISKKNEVLVRLQLDDTRKERDKVQQLALVYKKDYDEARQALDLANALVSSLRVDVKDLKQKSTATTAELAGKIKEHGELLTKMVLAQTTLRSLEKEVIAKSAQGLAAAKNLAELDQQLKDSQTKVARLEKLATDLRQEVKDYQSKLTVADVRVTSLEKQETDLRLQVKDYQSKLTVADVRVTSLEKQETDLRLQVMDYKDKLTTADLRLIKLAKQEADLRSLAKDYKDRLNVAEIRAALLTGDVKSGAEKYDSLDKDFKDLVQKLDVISQRFKLSQDAREKVLESIKNDNFSLKQKINLLVAAADNRFAGITLTGSRVIFLVDMSGSMELIDDNTKEPDKWPLVCETVGKLMGSLPDLKKYQVILFSDKMRYPFGQQGKWLDHDPMTSIKATVDGLKAIPPKGATNMYIPFEEAFRFRADGLDTIYLLSDGLPNVGPGLPANLTEAQRTEFLSKRVRTMLKSTWNPSANGQRVRINAIGFFFESPDVGAFLWALARENDGSFVGMSKP